VVLVVSGLAVLVSLFFWLSVAFHQNVNPPGIMEMEMQPIDAERVHYVPGSPNFNPNLNHLTQTFFLSLQKKKMWAAYSNLKVEEVRVRARVWVRVRFRNE
jgi:hypothetical protein